jgi:hypothetical protein
MEESMEYDWEKDVDYDFIEEIVDCELPRGVVLVGLALANMDSVEGCLITNPIWVGRDIAKMDIWKDIDGDAEKYYQKCLDADREYYDKRQAAKRKEAQ